MYQNTGEDWEDVILSFTNEDDKLSKTIPSLNPMYVPPHSNRNRSRSRPLTTNYNPLVDRVYGYIYDDTGFPLIGANVLLQGTTHGTITDLDGYYELHFTPGTSQQVVISYLGYSTTTLMLSQSELNVYLSEGELLDEVVVTSSGLSSISVGKKVEPKPERYNYATPNATMEETTLNFSFKMDKPYSIYSDGKNNEIALRDIELESSYKYKTIPKLSDKVYLMAYVNDWEDKNLLKGNMSLYFEGSYIGMSLLDPHQLQDSMHISLGTDSKIQVERERNKYFTKKKFVSGKKHTEIGYTISLKNFKNFDIGIEVWDQIPVSTIKEIKVEPAGISKGFQINEKNGIGYWNTTLRAKETKEYKIGFDLKYPTHYHFNF